jgi:hypothetical protein
MEKGECSLEKLGMTTKILITGNMGYVGPVLLQALAKAFPKAELIGCDPGFFGHAITGSDIHPEYLLRKHYFSDVRDISPAVLTGVDAIVHLAAISNDPMGNEFAEVTAKINQEFQQISMAQNKLSRVSINELSSKMKSKKELYNFLLQDCQAYLPPMHSTNVYFLKKIMKAEKEVSIEN